MAQAIHFESRPDFSQEVVELKLYLDTYLTRIEQEYNVNNAISDAKKAVAAYREHIKEGGQ